MTCRKQNLPGKLKYWYIQLAKAILVAVLVLGFTNCATTFGGRHNTLVFKTDNAEKAKVYLDGEYIGEAPGKILLKRTTIQHGSILEIKAEGYETQKYLILRKPHVIYTLADVFTGGVWLGVDYATGNIYRPSPRMFSYTLDNIQ